MPKSGEARTSAMVWDGAEVRSSGFGLIAHSTGAVQGSYSVIPFDAYIVEIGFVVGVLASSVSAAVQVGTLASGAAIVASTALTNLAAGTKIVLNDDASFVSAAARKVSRGDIINMNTAAATAVGSVGGWIVLSPRVD